MLVQVPYDTNFVVTRDSRVGIGIGSPKGDIHIGNKNGRIILGLNNEATFELNKKRLVINGSNGTSVQIGSSGYPANTYLYGKLYVGTSSPPLSYKDYEVVICGRVLCDEVKVIPKGWCDNVFSEDYRLMSFKELVKYYRSNHHLPEIPSEEEVLGSGIEVGEMNRILLKKLEEAYLYLEESYNRIEELEQEVYYLKKVINK